MAVSDAQQNIFDLRYKESFYSGGIAELSDEDEGSKEKLENLVSDYARLRGVDFGHLSEENTDSLVAVNENDSSNPSLGKAVTVDELVAPYSSRISSPTRAAQVRSLNPIAEWEGYVEGVGDDDFWVRLVNVKSGENLPTDEARFAKSELSEFWLPHLEVGAIVRWVIGQERLPNGQRRRVSELHFRRLPAHSEKEYKRAIEDANELIAALDWDDTPPPR